MSTSLLYHTQGIRGFQFLNFKYKPKTVIAEICKQPSKFKCRNCKSFNVKATYIKNRLVKGLPIGSSHFYINVQTHRVKCRNCNAYLTEDLDFLSSQKCHYTKRLEQAIIELRPEMTIQALAIYFNLHWGTVKEIEKRHLRKKYSKVNLRDVSFIGIDEIHMGLNGFLTIVRDLEKGSVLHIGDGKGSDALSEFTFNLKSSKANIKAVALDFGRPYSKWARESVPDAIVVYDHFHLIKLMNDKLDKIRRSTMLKLEDEDKKRLKNKRWLFLKNIENLEEETKDELETLRTIYNDLGTASMLKESLRNIYSIAEFDYEAELALNTWCKMAIKTGISFLKTMAKTITQNLTGILSYWNLRITTAAMEGFNNKIRWLNKQAYGYRDTEYLKLKIFDLPKVKNLKLC